MSTKKHFSSGSSFERDIGYSRAVLDDHYLHISGTTGYDYATMTINPDPAVQAEQAMQNIAEILEAAQMSFADVVRVRYILPNAEDFEPCWPVLKQYLGAAAPAATMLVAGLYQSEMKIEVELTAQRPDNND